MLLNHPKWGSGVVGATALVMILAACGTAPDSPRPDAETPAGSGATQQPAGELDACALLTQKEISAATGEQFKPGELNESLSGPGRSICDWESTSGGVSLVQVVVGDGDTYEPNKQSAADIDKVEELDGLGDEAYSTLGGSTIGMRADGYFLQVSWLTTSPTPPAATRELAEDALGNLP